MCGTKFKNNHLWRNLISGYLQRRSNNSNSYENIDAESSKTYTNMRMFEYLI